MEDRWGSDRFTLATQNIDGLHHAAGSRHVVELHGRLSRVRCTGCKYLADRPGQDAGADFIRVSTWNRQAETCAEYLAKGARVAVDGRLRSRSWEEDGKRRTAVEVVANRVQFLDSRREAESPFETAAAS